MEVNHATWQRILMILNEDFKDIASYWHMWGRCLHNLIMPLTDPNLTPSLPTNINWQPIHNMPAMLVLWEKLFKKLPDLDAAANHILQIYFKDITESSKLGKVDKIAKWKGTIKDAVHDLIARMDEIPMTLISINMFLKWHEDLGLIDHPWPEWKTTLSPSKTDIANHKWLHIIECQYDYHWLGLPIPCVVPTPIPPA
ncbi:hypothetical protein M404DRAFT_24698 [Pisolithus tinctorius Marx 270]|uniref:Uncharacterized protein n=1 Tax=Pisolithus tinctorius Marx 270 TaxID=870435 RepID=A0A0C3KA52_PISTI|nr:hypothetical protein M404DRAFT_24698 [Pisolithus tinctorius Marx 270]